MNRENKLNELTNRIARNRATTNGATPALELVFARRIAEEKIYGQCSDCNENIARRDGLCYGCYDKS